MDNESLLHDVFSTETEQSFIPKERTSIFQWTLNIFYVRTIHEAVFIRE